MEPRSAGMVTLARILALCWFWVLRPEVAAEHGCCQYQRPQLRQRMAHHGEHRGRGGVPNARSADRGHSQSCASGDQPSQEGRRQGGTDPEGPARTSQDVGAVRAQAPHFLSERKEDVLRNHDSLGQRVDGGSGGADRHPRGDEQGSSLVRGRVTGAYGVGGPRLGGTYGCAGPDAAARRPYAPSGRAPEDRAGDLCWRLGFATWRLCHACGPHPGRGKTVCADKDLQLGISRPGQGGSLPGTQPADRTLGGASSSNFWASAWYTGWSCGRLSSHTACWWRAFLGRHPGWGTTRCYGTLWLGQQSSGDERRHRSRAGRRPSACLVTGSQEDGVAFLSEICAFRATLPQLECSCSPLLRMGALQQSQDRAFDAVCRVSPVSCGSHSPALSGVQLRVGCCCPGVPPSPLFLALGPDDFPLRWACAAGCHLGLVSSAAEEEHWAVALSSAASPFRLDFFPDSLPQGQCANFGCYPFFWLPVLFTTSSGHIPHCPAFSPSGLGPLLFSLSGELVPSEACLGEATRAVLPPSRRSKVPKCCIGGAGATTLCSRTFTAILLALARLSTSWVHAVGQAAASFFLTLAGLALAILWQMLGAVFPGRRTPLGALLWAFHSGLPLRVATSLGSVGSPQHAVLDWAPHRPARRASGRIVRGPRSLSGAGTCSMAWLLVACLWSLPVCVWSAPPGIPPVDALSDSAAAASRRYPEPPDPLEDTPGYPPERAPDVVHPALNPPRGPPPPFPVRREIPTLPRQTVPVVVRDVVCGAYVLSPGYQPEAVTFRLGFPVMPRTL